MTIRSLVVLVVIFLVVALSVQFAQQNRGSVTLDLPGLDPFGAPIWGVVYLSALTGVLLALLYSLGLSFREAVQRWRSSRRDRTLADIAGTVKQALEESTQGNDAAALSLLEGVIARKPDHLEAWLLGGNAARRVGNDDRALEMHLRAQGLGPSDPRVLDALAADFAAAGDDTRALRYLEQRVDLDPRGAAEVHGKIRSLHSAAGRWQEALEAQTRRLGLLRGAARSKEESIARGIRLEIALRALKAGDTDAAVDGLRKLVKAAADFVPAHLALGDAYEATGDVKAAAAAWTKGFERTGSLEILRRLATFHLDNEVPERAIGTLREAAESLEGENGLAASVLLGRLYYRLEMHDEARATFDGLEDSFEYAPTVRYYQAKLAQRRGDPDAAFDTLKSAIRDAGFLDSSYACDECGGTHPGYTHRCEHCGAWGRMSLDLAREIKLADGKGVRAPNV